jgi:NAD(P) transhydrogenase subunit alpha
MRIGVPKETLPGETRVASTPEVVKKLVAKGFSVVFERGAGSAAHFPDAEFEQAGAQLADRAAALGADIVLRVRKSAADDIAGMRRGAVLVGFVETCEDDGTLAALHARGVRVIALERVPRISRA